MSAQFEGVEVTEYQAKLPSITVDCDYYKSGTVLRLAVEVRVKGVGYEEDKDGNYVRQHKLAIQDIEVVSSFDPASANDKVAGSLASGAGNPDIDTGLDVGHTSDQWPVGIRVDKDTGEIIEVSDSESEEVRSLETVDAGF